MDGKDAGRFAPGEAISRAEFVDLLDKALAAGGEAAAGREGSTGGQGTDSPLTREEAAVALYEELEAAGRLAPAAETADFADAGEISERARAAVAGLADKGLMTGRLNNKFAPKESLTRAEAAQLLWRIAGVGQ